MRCVGLAAAAGLLACAGSAQAILMTFEDIPGDVQAINNHYTGVTFGSSTSGNPLVTRRVGPGGGSYNVSSYPSGTVYGTGQYWVYGVVGFTSSLDPGGSDGKISFNNQDATYVEIGYSCNSTFTMNAYRADGTQIDTDSGGANLRYANGNAGGPGTLRVDWNGTDHIAWVIVHDTGNFWVCDNVQTDATGVTTGVIPLPSAAGMGLAGLGLVGLRRRR